MARISAATVFGRFIGDGQTSQPRLAVAQRVGVIFILSSAAVFRRLIGDVQACLPRLAVARRVNAIFIHLVV